jgi:hypothetical protein
VELFDLLFRGVTHMLLTLVGYSGNTVVVEWFYSGVTVVSIYMLWSTLTAACELEVAATLTLIQHTNTHTHTYTQLTKFHANSVLIQTHRTL